MKHNYSLASLTTFKIGGIAESFVAPSSIKNLQYYLRQDLYSTVTFLGRASNVLIRDKGIRGLVVYLGKMKNHCIWLDSQTVHVEAGTRLNYLVKQNLERNLDAVFLSGIPGTVGGALKMNAGALKDTIWQHVQQVEILTRKGELFQTSTEKFSPGYRHVEGLPRDCWFTSAILKFTPQEKNILRSKQISWLKKRRLTQPLNYPNAGSIFRNPPGDYAARLIELSGLKGYRYGGAKVSDRHANFIINYDSATAQDVENLIQEIRERVQKKFKVSLVPEIQIIGI